MDEYHRASHLVYLCRYHVVFCPKYRKAILQHGIDELLKQQFIEIAESHSFSIVQMEVMPDDVHLLIDCSQRYGITTAVGGLKQGTSFFLMQKYPALRCRCDSI